jgi:hypothetical protein
MSRSAPWHRRRFSLQRAGRASSQLPGLRRWPEKMWSSGWDQPFRYVCTASRAPIPARTRSARWSSSALPTACSWSTSGSPRTGLATLRAPPRPEVSVSPGRVCVCRWSELDSCCSSSTQRWAHTVACWCLTSVRAQRCPHSSNGADGCSCSRARSRWCYSSLSPGGARVLRPPAGPAWPRRSPRWSLPRSSSCSPDSRAARPRQ